MSTIDWTKPIKFKSLSYKWIGAPEFFAYTDEGNVLIKYHGEPANSLPPYYRLMSVSGLDLEGSRDDFSVINVPEEPANCVALIKYDDDCADESCRDKWFVVPHQEDADGNIIPMRRSELELFVRGFEPYVIVELPS